MEIELVSSIVTLLVVFFFLFRLIKIIPENERVAVTVMGKYAGLRGPGLLIKWRGGQAIWTRLALGDLGEYLGDGLAKFNAMPFPVDGENLKDGDSVRINSFRENKIWVLDYGANGKTVVCEKCGHTMHV